MIPRIVRPHPGPPAAAWGSLLGVAFTACASRLPESISATPLGRGPLAQAEYEERKAASDQLARSTKLANASEPPPPRAPSSPDEEDSAWDDSELSLQPLQTAESLNLGAIQTAFEGVYRGEDTATFHFSGQPKQTQEDPKAKIRLLAEDYPEVALVLVNSDTGEDLCTLLADVSGSVSLQPPRLKAKIRSGQPCFTEEGGNLYAEVLSGRVDIDESSMTVRARGSLDWTGPEETISGRLRYSFAGQRQ